MVPKSHRQDTTKWGGVAQTPAQCHNTATFQTKIPDLGELNIASKLVFDNLKRKITEHILQYLTQRVCLNFKG